MKTRINQILVFTLFAFFLLAGNVNAEGTERNFASSLETIVEPALEIEAWMVDDNYWKQSTLYNIQFEESLDIEDWMISDQLFSYKAIEVVEETEKEIELESWMIDANIWD